MTPIQLLQKELLELEKSKDKSNQSFLMGSYSLRQNKKHLKNLNPQIEMFKKAIEKLTNK